MMSADDVQRRLDILWTKLENEGRYVDANTVALAQELIKTLSNTSDDNQKVSKQ